MQKILLLAGILLTGIPLYAQQLGGTYKNDTDSIAFLNDKATFRISGFGGLSSAHAGQGTYELEGNYLFIHTSDYTGKKTTIETLDSSGKDTCFVHAVSPQNYAIQGILVESRTKSGKLVSGKVTGNDGKIFFTPVEKISTIEVKSLGYHPASFSFTPGKDYRIKLAENDIIENKTAVFLLRTIDDETISLLMLTDNFNMQKEKAKELQKLEKKVQKSNKLDKRLKKVYVPYARKQ